MAKKVISNSQTVKGPEVEAPYVPDLGGGNEGVRSLPVVNTKIDALKTSPFVLWFHPSRWCVIEGEVVPQLQQFHLIPGVCNFTIGSDKKPKIQKHKLEKMEADWIMVEYSWGPNGSYIKQLDARIDGTNETTKIYLPVWCNAIAGSTATKVASGAYAAWLKSLLASGKLPYPDPYIGETKLDEVTVIINNMKRDKLAIPEKLIQASEAWKKLVSSGKEILDETLYLPNMEDEE
jgi:hypothetical protein